MIEVKNLTKTYGNVLAVAGISFTVHAGEIFGLLGPNGAGKTSTLECLEGLRQPTRGSLKVSNLDPWNESHRLRDVIGVQLQSAGFPEYITPAEAIKIFCAYHHLPPRYDLLERFGLGGKRNTQFFELSAGQQRRLTLALAIAHEPQVLFLDEPTAGLDVASRAELHTLIRELRARNTAIILATHDMAEAEELADQVAILLNGKITTIGTPVEITAAGAGLSKITLQTKNASLALPETKLPAVTQTVSKNGYTIYFSSDIGPTLAAIISHIEAHQDTLCDLRVERPSLEERFLEITQSNGKKPGGVL